MDFPEETTAPQSLCLSCGMCCDGTIFDTVPIKSEDFLPPLESAGIKIEKRKKEFFFNQPCTAFRQNCCQIYADRPTNCREYRCKLLRKYERGEISQTDALQQISRARKLKKMLEEEFALIFPESEYLSLSAAKKLLPENDEMIADPILLKKWGKAMLLTSALLDCLQTYFHFSDKKQSSDKLKGEKKNRPIG